MHSLSTRTPSIPSLYVKSLGKDANAGAIRTVFSKARECSPCLLIFEDVESLVNQNTRSVFLNEVDGLQGNDGIMMIGSTNYLDNLDPGIAKRPSRFDRKYYFALPGKTERKAYNAFWVRKLQKAVTARDDETVAIPEDLEDRIASVTEGFSFAYLQEMWVSALMSLVGTGKDRVPELDEEPMQTPVFGKIPWASLWSQAEREDGKEGETGDLLWRTIEAQVVMLKREMQDSKMSVEDAERNTSRSNARTGDARRGAGFGLR
ncbi:uncharacterized protein KY384_002926 [Bacidia gigantensis]|uniref:uncharacterized protein n=1 Tax=Bacidia gigantensis TaxID=2732470 RepID=UPI001D03C271|nr:uncharacterized protein KY384_002926 [Bacidia gigantensis]KAG8531298.1 hypothetical protein KY384_002926 [Bacidia gigantensis]